MSHPSVCPKCKYNRPIALSYCPHCRDIERDKKDPMGAWLTKLFEKMGVKVVTASDLPSKEKENARKETNSKSNSKLKSTKQEKQQATNLKSSNKFKTVQRMGTKSTKGTKKNSKTTKSKRSIKSRV